MYIVEAMLIMASYEHVFRPRPDRPWIEVIVGTLVWLVPPFVFDLCFGLPKWLFQVILVGSLLVTGGTMMAWIFLVHLNNNQPRIEREDSPAWQKAMLREIGHALERQAFFVQQLTAGGNELVDLSRALGSLQATINEHIRQVSLYRQIGMQVTDDILSGQSSSYCHRAQDVEDDE